MTEAQITLFLSYKFQLTRTVQYFLRDPILLCPAIDSLLNSNAYFNTITLTIAVVNISALSTNQACSKRLSTCHPVYQNLQREALVPPVL